MEMYFIENTFRKAEGKFVFFIAAVMTVIHQQSMKSHALMEPYHTSIYSQCLYYVLLFSDRGLYFGFNLSGNCRYLHILPFGKLAHRSSVNKRFTR